MPKVEFDSEDIFNLSLSLVGLILKSGPMTLTELESYFKIPRKTIIRAAKAAGNSEDLLRYESHFYLDEDLLAEEETLDFSVIQGKLSSPPQLSRSQVTAIATGLEYLSSLPQFTGDKDLEELKKSLNLSTATEITAVKLHPLEKLLNQLRQAIVDGVRIRATYINQLGQTSDREIDPLRIDFIGKRYYLRGFCHLSGELRSFRLDRISKLEVTNTAIDANSKGAEIPEAVYGSNPGNFEIEIEADADAYEIFWNFPTKQDPKQLADGSFRGVIRMGNPAAIARHVARYGGAVRVVGPEDARKAVHSFVSSALGIEIQVGED